MIEPGQSPDRKWTTTAHVRVVREVAAHDTPCVPARVMSNGDHTLIEISPETARKWAEWLQAGDEFWGEAAEVDADALLRQDDVEEAICDACGAPCDYHAGVCLCAACEQRVSEP